MFIAHIRESDSKVQTVQEHLLSVSQLAGEYGSALHISSIAELAGFLHDMGKYTSAFTHYLQSVVLKGERIRPHIDHSTAGAKYLYENFWDTQDMLQCYVVEIVGMAILSHHSGLQNFLATDGSIGDYMRRVDEKDLPYYEEVVQNFESYEGNKERVIKLMKQSKAEFTHFLEKAKTLNDARNAGDAALITLSHLQKLVFSILIDADRTDTRRFEEATIEEKYDKKKIFESAYHNLNDQLQKWAQREPTPLDQLRANMSDRCDVLAEQPSQIWTLSIPTGGGKTLASLRYALKHAMLHDKKRIIYVVPYTTILEQNAQAVRKYFDDPSDVLEHHANVIDDENWDAAEDYYGRPIHKKMQLGRDNWDHPVIFTTMVQFLDAFYARGTRKGRRMHRLTEAVIVFDEVQSVPLQHQDLFNTAINFLADYGKSSILLCTATQPTVHKMDYPIYLKENAEMVPQLEQVAEAFERVRFHDEIDPKGWDTEQLATFIEQKSTDYASLLIVLNTKSAVLQLYEALQHLKTHTLYHLSTSMCAAHRHDILSKIRKRLDNQLPTICISTQLIEAGVDISFEAVVRSLAGLDSIAQAAGRCNRNAERAYGDVYLVKLNSEALDRLPEIRVGAETTLDYVRTEDDYLQSLVKPSMIERFYSFYYETAKRAIKPHPKEVNRPLIYFLNKPELYLPYRKTAMVTMYKTVERHFQAIDSPTTGIIVPYNDEAKELIAALNEELPLEHLNALMKRAQQYVVNVYDYTLQALIREDLIDVLYHDSLYVLLEGGYHENYGISIEGDGQKSSFIF